MLRRSSVGAGVCRGGVRHQSQSRATGSPLLRAVGPRDCALEGKQLLNSPQFNKGSAFNNEERYRFQLNGLLPPHVHTLEMQVDRAYRQFQSRPDNLSKSDFLTSMREQNEVLYFRLVSEHIKEMLPIIYTPTAGERIANYSNLFRRPEGLFLNLEFSTKEDIKSKLEYWGGEDDIDYIIVTDSEGILGIGDQGIGGIGISVAKCGLMTLCAGVHPYRVLPVVLDVGTDNDDLLSNELYMGLRRRRARGTEYDDFVHNCIEAFMERYPKAVIHFEDFGISNAKRLLDYYSDKHCVFNDDIQGTGAVTLAAITSAALVAEKERKNMKYIVFGAGSAGMGIANQLKEAMVMDGLSDEEAIARIYLVDSLGLLLESHHDYLTPAQRPFAKSKKEFQHLIKGVAPIKLADVVDTIKPDVLLGCSGQPNQFTEDVVKTMASHVERPIILPLSNPTRLAEARPSDIIRWTEGRALVATGSPFPQVEYNGQHFSIAESNNALVYPGIGLGCVLSRARRLTPGMIKAAADALATESPALTDPSQGVLPDVKYVRETSFKVAIAVIKKAVEEGVADRVRHCVGETVVIPVDDDHELANWVRMQQWMPKYRQLRKVEPEFANAQARGETGIGRIK